MGIKGFKVDFMDRDDQTAIEMVERLAACTAKHHLILDLHGIYKPVGLNRTYPNILNYESVFGMEECHRAKSESISLPPERRATTGMLAVRATGMSARSP